MNAKKRAILIRIAAVALLLLLTGAMFIVGRGHTVYLDNKTLEYNGETYSAFQRAKIYVGGEEIAKLGKRERGMATCIGQSFQMTLEITAAKGDEPKTYPIALKLPYGMDGIVINLPALLAGLPEEAYQSEFVSLIPEEAPAEDDTTTEEFPLGDI